MPVKKRGDLGGRTIRILTMREVPHLREGCQIQVNECLAKAIGPFIGEQWIMFRRWPKWLNQGNHDED